MREVDKNICCIPRCCWPFIMVNTTTTGSMGLMTWILSSPAKDSPVSESAIKTYATMITLLAEIMLQPTPPSGTRPTSCNGWANCFQGHWAARHTFQRLDFPVCNENARYKCGLRKINNLENEWREKQVKYSPLRALPEWEVSSSGVPTEPMSEGEELLQVPCLKMRRIENVVKAYIQIPSNRSRLALEGGWV